MSDLGLIGIAAALAIVDFMVWATDPVIDSGRLPWSIALAVPCVGTLAVIAVAVRQRHLMLALTSLAGTSVVLTLACWAIASSLPPSFAAMFAFALLTTTALRVASAGSAVLLASLAALAVAAEALRPMVSAVAYLLVACEGAFSVAVGVGVYLRWSDWRRVTAEEAARAHERLEIARELHDMVGHYVTGIVVRAQAARHVSERQPAAAAAALQSIETAGTNAMIAMRHMVGGLRHGIPTSPTSSGAAWDDIDRLVANAVAAGEPVHATIDPTLRGTALSLVPSVHRIIVESLTNVRRHAHEVTSIDVDVTRCDDRVIVTVSNDGLGSPPSGHDTFGIIGMRERAAALGGALVAGPAAGGGWLVRAELPIGHPR
ncbi:MAG: two-component sensor histidine kinase [Actinobacteria bacterium]|nr:two-component sensor histidine kinase [Actinomycetota bacterium]